MWVTTAPAPGRDIWLFKGAFKKNLLHQGKSKCSYLSRMRRSVGSFPHNSSLTTVSPKFTTLQCTGTGPWTQISSPLLGIVEWTLGPHILCLSKPQFVSNDTYPQSHQIYLLGQKQTLFYSHWIIVKHPLILFDTHFRFILLFYILLL